MGKITDIEGIGGSYGEKLSGAGIGTTEQLLEACCKKAGRKAMAEKTGIPEKMILKWTNMADLFRIKGVGGEFAELLEAAGVDTVKELRNCNSDNLAKKMATVNEAKKLTRRVPNADAVKGWVSHAKELPPKIEY